MIGQQQQRSGVPAAQPLRPRRARSLAAPLMLMLALVLSAAPPPAAAQRQPANGLLTFIPDRAVTGSIWTYGSKDFIFPELSGGPYGMPALIGRPSFGIAVRAALWGGGGGARRGSTLRISVAAVWTAAGRSGICLPGRLDIVEHSTQLTKTINSPATSLLASQRHHHPKPLNQNQVSGGGHRATTLALGWVRALHSLGALNAARYLASNSGGSWFNAAYSYSQVCIF